MRVSNQQSYYNQNTSFKMLVRFAKADELSKLKELSQGAFAPLVMSSWPYTIKNLAKSSDKLLTVGACDCSVIGLTNKEEAAMTHLIPNEENLDDMENFSKPASLNKYLRRKLQENIDELKQGGKIVKAFIIGGQDREDEERRSISLFKGLYDLLGENKIRPTIIWGQKAGRAELDALYSVKEDALTIFPNSFILCYKLTPEFVKNYFEFIRFNPEDRVMIKNTRQKRADFVKDGSDLFKKTCEKLDYYD